MSHGRDEDDDARGPRVLLLVPGEPDRVFKRGYNEDRKVELQLVSIDPAPLAGHLITGLIPYYNMDHAKELGVYVGMAARGKYSSSVNEGFTSVINKNPIDDELIGKLRIVAELTGENAKYEVLARCEDHRIRFFKFQFDSEGKHGTEVDEFTEPTVFFPNGWIRTKTQLVKTLQDRIDKQVAVLQQYFDPEYGQMNFAGFQ